MKNIILLLALLSGEATVAQAQSTIKAGTVSLGGSIGYSQQHSENFGTTTRIIDGKAFSVAPSVGYFVADNLAIGLIANYYISKSTDFYDYPSFTSTARNTQVGGGAFVQYYQMLTRQFGLTGTLRANYGHYNSKSSYQSTTNGDGSGRSTGNSFSADVIPSIVFFPIPKLELGASFGSVGYNHSSGNSENFLANNSPSYDHSKSSGFGANFGINFFAFNGTYYFGRQAAD